MAQPNAPLSFATADDVITAYTQVNLVGGARVASAAALDVKNPATGAVLGKAAASNAEETEAAVATAKAAQAGWAAIPARTRGKMVAEAARAVAAQSEMIAQVLARETGKAIRTECRGEITVAADILEFYGALGSELKGQTVPFNPRMMTTTTLEPLGVVAAILPWNVPLVLGALKIGPALVAGNTVVVKASEEAPFATFLMAEIMTQYLPAGVLNVINGDGKTCGTALTHHEDVAKITFTGSEAVGEAIYKVAASRIIPASLELGGKSPMIICADADLDKAVAGAISGMRFTRQGQSCTAASRIYVHDDLFDSFMEKLGTELEKLVIGDPLDESTDVGTVINQKQMDVIQGFVAQAEATEGADIRRFGALPEGGDLAPDLFMQPTLLLGLPEDHPCVTQEIFGPVAAIQRWSDYEDVIARANGTHYGLAASVWTKDLSTALDSTSRLNAGYVQVNQNLTIQPNVSYGGFGRSGLGKEASLEAMVEHFTRSKTIVINFD
ncbi:aldehyde dehydrogenase family protein [Epibacterium sp. SM1979]|uniref:Aldehyde dehydrogenase family protein n=1 Tax=Tritonibacter litoralis TaxID=2662264 RepID=A0A843YIT1_9RHOB|nr:aldehyde dehydrogenase family protein [Tritonibacter litoralis]MQQ09059.1 aldehyde dehydrogenase family protein [Tritonibacter litoralis]